ncbi:hypothetical protein NQZ68_012016 [Dissostichus eleginoides]|nr:hypothetical protein NQZ68_012016 [Dissostichus eleginoides]
MQINPASRTYSNISRSIPVQLAVLWQLFKLAMPSGGKGELGLEGVLQQMFPVCPTGGGGSASDDGDERTGDLSSPLPHTSLSRHVSVIARSIWWPSAPADLPCASKAAPVIFTPYTCQVCQDHGTK